MLQRQMLVVGVLVVMLAAGTVLADTKVVQMKHTGAIEMMGQKQEAKDEESVIWFGEDRMSHRTGDTGFIVRLDTKKLYVVNFDDSTYSEIDLPVDLTKELPEEMAAQMDMMKEMMKFDVSVTPTEEYKTIGSWKARKYDLSMSGQMMQMKTTIWASTEISTLNLDAAREMSKQMMMLQPGMDAVADELAKIEGFQLELVTTATMMGSEMESRTETTAIEDATPPEGTYDVPAGFTESEFNPMRR